MIFFFKKKNSSKYLKYNIKFMFLVKLVFAYLIPDVPEEIQLAIEREKYLSRITLESIYL